MTDSGQTKSDKSVYRHMLRGTAWTVLMRWSLRGVGLLSTVILARLLVPEDFGVVAMGALIIGFIEGFSELGVQMHLIRKPNASRDDCNTAWTLGLIQHIFIAVILVLLSGHVADYFSEPRLTEVIYWVAASAVITGFTNIGMTALVRKELDFAKDFRFNLYRRVLSFFSVISLAFFLRDYWALVYGQMLFAAYGLALSYMMHQYRPRWNLSKAGEFLTFSAAIIPINFAKYWRDKADILVVGKIGSVSALGVYSVASEMAAMISQEIIKPVSRALLPSYAKLARDHKKLSEAFLHVLNTICIISIPLGLGLSVLAYEFVVIIFGPKWVEAAPFLQWLAIYGVVRLISTTLSESILIVSGHEKRSAIAITADGVVLLVSVVFAGLNWGVIAIPIAAIFSALMMLPFMAYFLIRSLPISWLDLARTLWPPCVSGLSMVAGINYTKFYADTTVILGASLSIVIGATIYVAGIVTIWYLRGRPSGVEKKVLCFLWRRYHKA